MDEILCGTLIDYVNFCMNKSSSYCFSLGGGESANARCRYRKESLISAS